jgi:hypothetical protein
MWETQSVFHLCAPAGSARLVAVPGPEAQRRVPSLSDVISNECSADSYSRAGLAGGKGIMSEFARQNEAARAADAAACIDPSVGTVLLKNG